MKIINILRGELTAQEKVAVKLDCLNATPISDIRNAKVSLSGRAFTAESVNVDGEIYTQTFVECDGVGWVAVSGEVIERQISDLFDEVVDVPEILKDIKITFTERPSKKNSGQSYNIITIE